MEQLPENWQVRNTSKLFSATMTGVVHNSKKKSQKSKHYLKIGIYEVLDYCDIFILSGWEAVPGI